MLWDVDYELSCQKIQADGLCKAIRDHHCIIYARPLAEQGEQQKGQQPHTSNAVDPNWSIIICKAQVQHLSEEETLVRHMRRCIHRYNATVENSFSQQKHIMRRYILRTAGIAALILFVVVVGHEVVLRLGKSEPLDFGTLGESLVVAIIAALVYFLVEWLVILREHEA